MTTIRAAIQKLFDYYAPRNIEILRVLVFYGLNWREGPLDQFPDSKKVMFISSEAFKMLKFPLTPSSPVKVFSHPIRTMPTIINFHILQPVYRHFCSMS